MAFNTMQKKKLGVKQTRNTSFGEQLRNVGHKVHEDVKKKDQSDITVSQHFNSSDHELFLN